MQVRHVQSTASAAKRRDEEIIETRYSNAVQRNVMLSEGATSSQRILMLRSSPRPCQRSVRYHEADLPSEASSCLEKDVLCDFPVRFGRPRSRSCGDVDVDVEVWCCCCLVEVLVGPRNQPIGRMHLGHFKRRLYSTVKNSFSCLRLFDHFDHSSRTFFVNSLI